jgi:hypothetical protein
MLHRFAKLLLTLILFAAAPAYADESAAWAALREGGHIILMRHATTTPGVGDPPNFRLGDCATQRLLSGAGRAQAKAIGAALRKSGVRVDRVLTELGRLRAAKRLSHWCSMDASAKVFTTRWLPVGRQTFEYQSFMTRESITSKRIGQDRLAGEKIDRRPKSESLSQR